MSNQEIQDKLTKDLNNIFEDPVYSTDSHELALQAISILGREYSLASYGKDNYIIFLSYNRDIFRESVRLLSFTTLTNSKEFYQYRDFTERLFKMKNEARFVCETISKVFEDQKTELIKKEKERIEREEEIRAKYRNWR